MKGESYTELLNPLGFSGRQVYLLVYSSHSWTATGRKPTTRKSRTWLEAWNSMFLHVLGKKMETETELTVDHNHTMECPQNLSNVAFGDPLGYYLHAGSVEVAPKFHNKRAHPALHLSLSVDSSVHALCSYDMFYCKLPSTK